MPIGKGWRGEGLILRRVGSPGELREAFNAVGAQFSPPITHGDRRFVDLETRFDADRTLMLIVVNGGRFVGGAFGFRRGDGVTLRMIGLEAEFRGIGLGRRLLQTFEVEAMRLGARSISLGAEEPEKGFYSALGYRGKSSMHKELPLPGRVLDARLEKLAAALGDLEVGQSVVPVSGGGRVPPLW